MKITYSWLKDHLDTKLNENQIIDKLTDIGLEVESVDSQSSDLESFVVAKILKAEKHPNADRLKVCKVETVQGNFQVVCGAPNAKAGMIGIFAPTIAIAGRDPFWIFPTCIDPPRPPQQPVSLAKSSAIKELIDTPFAIACPCGL